MTWLFFIREWSELPNIILQFYNVVCFQFNKRVKIFRSNNALEYTQHAMYSFCIARGIIHQTSCAHTSQQNSVAERKHRTLLNIARTMMFNMHVPKHFWGDAILTACYLVNRVLSVGLGNQCPFSLLYPDRPPSPRVFGCVAFVHVLDPSQDKLSPHLLGLVSMSFLGTPVLKKAIVLSWVLLYSKRLSLLLFCNLSLLCQC